MISHIFIGTNNFDSALSFYQALMPVLGIEQRFVDRGRPWAAWESPNGPRPLLILGKPSDGQAHVAGNGQMVALLAGSRSIVEDAYRTALANGGISEGAPGLRPGYHENYYGAYFRDLDGNKLCVVCHLPPT
jgi:lactoylglutathione lyase